MYYRLKTGELVKRLNRMQVLVLKTNNTIFVNCNDYVNVKPVNINRKVQYSNYISDYFGYYDCYPFIWCKDNDYTLGNMQYTPFRIRKLPKENSYELYKHQKLIQTNPDFQQIQSYIQHWCNDNCF